MLTDDLRRLLTRASGEDDGKFVAHMRDANALRRMKLAVIVRKAHGHMSFDLCRITDAGRAALATPAE